MKNRFGSTNEIGVFEMCNEGLREVENPSEYMLWNLWIESILPNKPIPRRMIDNIGNHIQELSESALLMTEEEVKEFMEYKRREEE